MSSWKEKAKIRRQQQADSIPPEWRLPTISTTFSNALTVIESCGILSDHELQITNTLDGRIIAEKISSRTWTSEEVIVAFCKRAAVAQQLIGCCTEMMFEAAIQRARELDEHLAKTGKVVGPFHGLPISLKDSQNIKGIDTTLGWVGMIGKPAKEDNLPVQQYKALGAVVYCKTNIPQSLMMSDSYNHVFGQSVNALNKNLISGGSSGGEGALIGAHGSLIGIGTDIGGSIRIPAVLQGLYGLNPTIGRIMNRESGRTQKYIVPPVAGPMATSLSSIEYFMESYLSSQPWTFDPQILPIPWRGNLALPPTRPLKIGYIASDGVILPQPPVRRVLHSMVKQLQSAGHNVFEWDASSHGAAYYDLWLPGVLADGGERFASLCALADEPLIEGMLVGTPETLLSNARRQELAERIWEYQAAYLRRWESSGVDAVLMPVLPWVGMRPKTWVKSQQYCGYTAHWNLLNYTALAIPAGVVDSKVDQPDDAWLAYEGASFSDRFNHEQYDVDLVDGMPIGLQIVTGRFGEEKAIAIAKVLEALSTNPGMTSSTTPTPTPTTA